MHTRNIYIQKTYFPSPNRTNKCNLTGTTLQPQDNGLPLSRRPTNSSPQIEFSTQRYTTSLRLTTCLRREPTSTQYRSPRTPNEGRKDIASYIWWRGSWGHNTSQNQMRNGTYRLRPLSRANRTAYTCYYPFGIYERYSESTLHLL